MKVLLLDADTLLYLATYNKKEAPVKSAFQLAGGGLLAVNVLSQGK